MSGCDITGERWVLVHLGWSSGPCIILCEVLSTVENDIKKFSFLFLIKNLSKQVFSLKYLSARTP